MHRMDPETPIEDTMRVLKSLVEEGKIKYIGLSECTPSELRRAHAIHPVTAIQMEWSLQSRDLEAAVVPVARELGVGIVAYSPLCRGFLTAIDSFDKLEENDFRRNLPRYSDNTLEQSKAKVARFFEIAKEKKCTPAQLALAWVHAQENAEAVDIHLTPEDVKAIAAAAESIERARYPGQEVTFNARLDNI
ncbi:hypothetical protein AC1031_003236 [Aphanomyces cochlioides]|nr:hypothetical protein AC1031_003236 [Aphanomyces cochlioides]